MLKNILHQQSNLPADAPVMALRETLLFPNTMLPLRIFEERYRQMLHYCLQNHRMFCIALVKKNVADARTIDDFHHFAGLGLIRAARLNQDGTFAIVLQGVARVQFVNFLQSSPFPIAQIREVRSRSSNILEAEALGVKVVELCERLGKARAQIPEKLTREIAHLENPAVLSDVVTNTFIRDPFRRQNILEQPVVSERLRLLIEYLHGEIGKK